MFYFFEQQIKDAGSFTIITSYINKVFFAHGQQNYIFGACLSYGDVFLKKKESEEWPFLTEGNFNINKCHIEIKWDTGHWIPIACGQNLQASR